MRHLIAFLKRFQVFLIFAILQGVALTLYFTFFTFPRTQYLTSASAISGSIFSIKNSITQYMNLDNTNTILQKSNERLLENSPLSYMRMENGLTKIEDTLYKQQYEYISATVINSTVEKRNNYFTLNIGTEHGVKRGMGVISDNGVVGKIHNANKYFSVVKSVLTEDINTDVMVEKQGIFGLLKWDGRDARRGSITGISNDLQIEKGTKIITRGGAGIFPRGIAVGKLEKLNKIEGEAFWNTSILFSEDFRKLQKVYVVRNILLEEQKRVEQSIPKEKGE